MRSRAAMVPAVVALGVLLAAMTAAPAGAQDFSGFKPDTSSGASPPVGSGVYEEWPDRLGFSVNNAVGAGLSWQRWFGLNGVTVTAGGLYDPAGRYNDFVMSDYDLVVLDYNIQLRLARMLFSARYSPWYSSNLQAVLILAHRGEIGMDLNPMTPTELAAIEGGDHTSYVPSYSMQPYRPGASVAAGVGMENTLFGHLSQTMDFTYALSWPLKLTPAFGWSIGFRY